MTDPVAARAPRTFLGEALKRFRRHKLAVASLGLLVVLSLAAVFAPYLTPYTFDGQDVALLGMPTPPSLAHPMGTDHLGRDNATRVLYGARVSLLVGLLSALIATLVGTVVGALAGFYGGATDNVLMRATDVVLSIPLLPLVIVLSGFLRPNLYLLVLIIGVLGWMGTARLVRSQFLSLRGRDFVEASRALGGSGIRIMFLHMLPNALGPILVSTTLSVGGAILLESALSFFGFGVQPPTPTWGNLLNSSRDWLDIAPWIATFPGLFILMTVLAVNFLGDGLRDAFDPRL
ncbi:MAG: ABC transporter permease [Trueperaceae bacterium]|nr:ABC transporter permease [Trueperaceae bacterium]MCO5173167.1 ABC transporter permease [Trueperaceae bacterium]MCW5818431.1 ABC transporter permease [Trueperaceae bacterium]